jgi:hypothetical protein
MVAAVRRARDQAWVAIAPALVSWVLLFGYQWAFALSYKGHQHTVFAYHSGVLGDGVLIPAVNVAGFVVLRYLAVTIQWRRLPLYAFLGLLTATTAFLVQGNLDLVNWSMPLAYHWSDVGQFHFFVMWAELAYLYLVLAAAVNNWSALRRDLGAWSSFRLGLVGLALFAWTLAADYLR